MVTWVTLTSAVKSSFVEYGVSSYDLVAVGEQTDFVDGGREHRQLFMHRVVLTNLRPDTRYGKFY